MKVKVYLISIITALLLSPYAWAGVPFNYAKTVVKSLEIAKEAHDLVSERTYDSEKPTEIVKTRIALQKAIKKIEKAKVQLKRHATSENEWVVNSIAMMLSGYNKMIKSYEEIIALLGKRLNKIYLDSDSAFHLEIMQKFSQLSYAAELLHNGVTIAAYSMVDLEKNPELGLTHLLITPQELTALNDMLLVHFPKGTTEVISRSDQPARAALYILHKFLNQDWQFGPGGVRVSSSVYNIELFNEVQLKKFNAT